MSKHCDRNKEVFDSPLVTKKIFVTKWWPHKDCFGRKFLQLFLNVFILFLMLKIVLKNIYASIQKSLDILLDVHNLSCCCFWARDLVYCARRAYRLALDPDSRACEIAAAKVLLRSNKCKIMFDVTFVITFQNSHTASRLLQSANRLFRGDGVSQSRANC